MASGRFLDPAALGLGSTENPKPRMKLKGTSKEPEVSRSARQHKSNAMRNRVSALLTSSHKDLRTDRPR